MKNISHGNAQPVGHSHIAVVVGVDLGPESAHLLAQTRDLVRTVDEPEIHVVHVVRPETALLRSARPDDAKDAGVVHEVARARALLEALCAPLMGRAASVEVHTPVGDAAPELARVATTVGADILVVEAHERHRGPWGALHRSTVDQITGVAPCTVLAIRRPDLEDDHAPQSQSEVPAPAQ
jgi:nucleotide-binding universal stress UspA family protein